MVDNHRRGTMKSKLMRSNKIMQQLSPTDNRPADIPEEPEIMSFPRSHTPGHLPQKSSADKQQQRKRSQSNVSSKSNPSTPASRAHSNAASPALPSPPTEVFVGKATTAQPSTKGDHRRPLALRLTSAIADKPLKTPTSATTTASPAATIRPGLPSSKSNRGPYIPCPPLPSLETSPNVTPAPASGMYWSLAMASGHAHTTLRAHTATLINSSIYIFGGCDSRSCFNELYVFDPDSMHWSSPATTGTPPIPLRAMTTTAVGKKLLIFGGGDGPVYYNDVYVLDTLNMRWSKPDIPLPHPSKRRAHTACLYKNGIYVFGGGDGMRALNDVWRFDVSDTSKMTWKLISPATATDERELRETKPKARGYHTANMVGSKLIIFGGSDGGECFKDIWIFDVETLIWHPITPPSPPPSKTSLTLKSTEATNAESLSTDPSKPPSRSSSLNRTSTQSTATTTTTTSSSSRSATNAKSLSPARLSHTATLVGSYLFIIGGHDGIAYSSDVLLLNLVTMTWDKRKIYGAPPPARGYHAAVLYDSRLFVIGGFDGERVFGEVYILELAVHAYFSQISHFSIEV